MTYANIKQRPKNGGIVILDGGTGTELERRGVPMDPEAWCGPATLQHMDVLEGIHRDYIAAGADIITANTYASSRLMLSQAGLADQFEDINRTAVAAAHRARAASGREGVMVAGWLPITPDRRPSPGGKFAGSASLADRLLGIPDTGFRKRSTEQSLSGHPLDYE